MIDLVKLDPELPICGTLQKMMTSLRPTDFPRFIGRHPGDCNRALMTSMMSKDCSPYYVTEKADGMRVLLSHLVGANQEVVWLVTDRKNLVSQLISNESKEMAQLHSQSQWTVHDVFDAELCRDKQSISILLFDSLLCSSKSVLRSSFEKRYEALQLRIAQLKLDPSKRSSLLLQISVKPAVRLSPLSTSELVTRLGKDLEEGLIFYKAGAPYFSKDKNDVFRWKYPDQITIDFEIKKISKTQNQSQFCLHAWTGMDKTKFVSVFQPNSSELEMLNMVCSPEKSVIGEFRGKGGSWELIRVRTDRFKANHINRVNELIGLIKEPVTTEDIIRLLQKRE